MTQRRKHKSVSKPKQSQREALGPATTAARDRIRCSITFPSRHHLQGDPRDITLSPQHKYHLRSLSTNSQTMSGLHVVQCLCHGQMFLGRVAQSTGDIMLQVRTSLNARSCSELTSSLASNWTLRPIPNSSNISQCLPLSIPITSTHRYQESH